MTISQNDELGDVLVAKGFVANRFVLDLNHHLSVPGGMALEAPWNLPSRLFRFPIEVSEPVDGMRRIGLMHPLLAAHPWVQVVEKALGVKLDTRGAPNGCGVSNTRSATWWHAVDLVTAEKWRDLIETRRFTTDEDIARAVVFGLSYSPDDAGKCSGFLTTQEARSIMAALGQAEPANRRGVLTGFAAPQSCCGESGVERWPVNSGRGSTSPVGPWTYIVALEDGWFSYDRQGFVGWTQAGRDRYAAGDQATFTEASGQGAFAF